MALETALAIKTNMAGTILYNRHKRPVRLPVKKDGSTCGSLGWSYEFGSINQLDSTIIDPSVLEEFGSQVRKEYISKVNIRRGHL